MLTGWGNRRNVRTFAYSSARRSAGATPFRDYSAQGDSRPSLGWGRRTQRAARRVRWPRRSRAGVPVFPPEQLGLQGGEILVGNASTGAESSSGARSAGGDRVRPRQRVRTRTRPDEHARILHSSRPVGSLRRRRSRAAILKNRYSRVSAYFTNEARVVMSDYSKMKSQVAALAGSDPGWKFLEPTSTAGQRTRVRHEEDRLRGVVARRLPVPLRPWEVAGVHESFLFNNARQLALQRGPAQHLLQQNSNPEDGRQLADDMADVPPEATRPDPCDRGRGVSTRFLSLHSAYVPAPPLHDEAFQRADHVEGRHGEFYKLDFSRPNFKVFGDCPAADLRRGPRVSATTCPTRRTTRARRAGWDLRAVAWRADSPIAPDRRPRRQSARRAPRPPPRRSVRRLEHRQRASQRARHLPAVNRSDSVLLPPTPTGRMRSPSRHERTVSAPRSASAETSTSPSPALPRPPTTRNAPVRESQRYGVGAAGSAPARKRNVPYSATAESPAPRSSERVPAPPRANTASASTRETAWGSPIACSASSRRTSRESPAGSRATRRAPRWGPLRAPPARSRPCSRAPPTRRAAETRSRRSCAPPRGQGKQDGQDSWRTRARAKRRSSFEASSRQRSPRSQQYARVSSLVTCRRGLTSLPRRGSIPSSARRPGDVARR